MFFIILGFLILTSIVTTIKFPNLTSGLTSKLPRFTLSKWFTNPRIKTLLRDREFFNQNVKKILHGPLFIVIGSENHKIHDILATSNDYGEKKSLLASEDAFYIVEHHGANFLFIHPNLVKTDKDSRFNTRTKLLINRICKYRRQQYIDGVVIFPNSEVFKKSDAPPSRELVNEIDFCTNVFQSFADFFRIRVPLYFIAHETGTGEHVLKNIFRHDPLTGNDDLYLGFVCDFSKKSKDEKFYEFFQNAMTVFENAFNVKTQSILQNSVTDLQSVGAVHTTYSVQTENFYLAKNYISFFLNYFDKFEEAEFSHLTILNSVLFASFDGSTPSESIRNLFYYLATQGKDKVVFSKRFLNYRRRLNIILSLWTVLFVSGGLFTGWKINQFLIAKRIIYVRNSVAVYQKFAKKFNTLLAGKFPFAPSSDLHNADFENISSVFQEFLELTQGQTKYFFDHIVYLTQRTDIQQFVDDMRAVDVFLHMQVIENAPPPLTFLVGVGFDFRVRPEDEFLANRIVDWSLTVEKQNYGSKYGSPKHVEFVWTYGNPLTFKVEFFAKEHENFDLTLVPKKPNENSPQIAANSHMYVQGNTVVFAYSHDSWSLLRFIDDHDICRNAKMPCPHPLLQFIIPLANQSNAVFFCNLELQDVDGKSLTIPHFPTAAPLFAKEPNY